MGGCGNWRRAPALVCLWILLAASVSAQERMPSGLTKIADGVFADIVSVDSAAAANSGVVLLDKGVLVFDTHLTPEAGSALLGRIRAVTSLPVTYLVCSHFHPDHTHGNQAFPDVRQILGSGNTHRDMIGRDLPELNRLLETARGQVDRWTKELDREQDPGRQQLLRSRIRSRTAFIERASRWRILPPVMALDDSLTILDNTGELRLLYLGRGHTDGDVVLYLPQRKTVFLGDLFSNGALPNTQDAYLLDWMKTLEQVLKLDAKTYVPGHGRIGTRRDVERFLAYLQELKAMVEPAVRRGDTVEQVVRELRVPTRYAFDSFQYYFPGNVQKMYAELKAEYLRELESKPSEEPDKPAPGALP